MREIKWLIIHHSATMDGKTFDWQAIRRYHLSLGWTDIGYHYGIESVNESIEVIMGRPITEIGAHAYGFNTNSLGICIVGNYDVNKLDDLRKATLIRLLKSLLLIFDLGVESVIGHRDVLILTNNKNIITQNYKTCPGTNISLQEIREILLKDEKFKIKDLDLFHRLNEFDKQVISQKRLPPLP